MPSLIAPYTLPSENTTEVQLSQNFFQMYILMGKALYSRNVCCNNQLKTIFPPRQLIFPGSLSFFQDFLVKLYNSSTFPGLENCCHFSRFSKSCGSPDFYRPSCRRLPWHRTILAPHSTAVHWSKQLLPTRLTGLLNTCCMYFEPIHGLILVTWYLPLYLHSIVIFTTVHHYHCHFLLSVWKAHLLSTHHKLHRKFRLFTIA